MVGRAAAGGLDKLLLQDTVDESKSTDRQSNPGTREFACSVCHKKFVWPNTHFDSCKATHQRLCIAKGDDSNTESDSSSDSVSGREGSKRLLSMRKKDDKCGASSKRPLEDSQGCLNGSSDAGVCGNSESESCSDGSGSSKMEGFDGSRTKKSRI